MPTVKSRLATKFPLFFNIFQWFIIYILIKVLKVISNIHLPEFLFFPKLSNVFAAGGENYKIGDRYVKCVARIHMK